MAWRNIKKRVKQRVSDLLEIPNDIMLDLPKIVLVGNLQVFIENHKGIVEYSPEVIRINVGEGEVVVTGEELMLRNILMDEICVEGRIKGLNFI
ncbi:sporulation protein YqfC [Desulfolucanica intricata]|uniref:sporulation protein YqfC n=1 Tax=Desulfolucanica intricata TaxID=1285191 RepID=UPI0008371127|nr:sporulation protein YqfC [Desulfolucanica intricata]